MSIELDRAVSSIRVGHRHRADLGDITELAASINDQGLLQPITITPEGVLVCGRRRLAAIQQLGWRTVSVWVRSGISDRLGHLLAEQDENTHRKALNQIEAAALYRELKTLMAEDAQRRQAASQFSTARQPGTDGGAKFAPPSTEAAGKTRVQAAAMIPGGASHATLEKITAMQRIADDPDLPETLREQVAAELSGVEAGGPVEPAFQRIRAAVSGTDQNQQDQAGQDQARQDQLHALADAAIARVTATDRDKKPARSPAGVPGRWPVAAFIQTWTSLSDWWTHYDVEELAGELTDEQATIFLDVAEGTAAFAARLRILLTTEENTDKPTEENTTKDTGSAENEDSAGDAVGDCAEATGTTMTRGHLRAL